MWDPWFVIIAASPRETVGRFFGDVGEIWISGRFFFGLISGGSVYSCGGGP